jgi:hydrogenase maturation protease
MSSARRILLMGYGNPGRYDDGLGPALADAIERLGLAGVKVDSDYQLTVEDAHAVAESDVVIFADADTACDGQFYFRKLRAGRAGSGFSSHSVAPAEVLALAREMFGSKTAAYVLGIRGYRFNEFGEKISDGAKKNLAAAAAFVEQAIRKGSFTEFPKRKQPEK